MLKANKVKSRTPRNTENELVILNGYFPNIQGFKKCIDEIQSIGENYDKATHLNERTPFKRIDEKWYKRYRKRKSYSNKFDFKKAISKIQILREFSDGKRLSQLQILGLATNFYWITGGFKWMKKTMNDFNSKGLTGYSLNNFNTLKYLRKKNKNLEGGYFKPMRLEQFSPHPDDHHFNDIETSVRIPNGYIQTIKKIKKDTLSESENKFKKSLRSFCMITAIPFICSNVLQHLVRRGAYSIWKG